MERPESHQFREDLAEEISSVSKEEQRRVLDEAKHDPEYWQSRKEKISERQNEEEIDDGLGVFVEKKTLYHGTGTRGIKRFNRADEETVGRGIYLTSKPSDAIGYARRRARARKDPSPVIYESTVENMRLLDLRKNENVKKVMDGFKQVLLSEKEKISEDASKWSYREVYRRAINDIEAGNIHSGNVKNIASFCPGPFSDYCKSLGYEGLVTFEGGEGSDVLDHDTYLVFDPKKVTINQEHKIV